MTLEFTMTTNKMPVLRRDSASILTSLLTFAFVAVSSGAIWMLAR